MSVQPIRRTRRQLLSGGGTLLVLSGCAPMVAAPGNTVSARPKPVGVEVAPAISTDPSLARHLLNRFGYGPRAGDVEHVCRLGAGAWIESQLQPARLTEPVVLDQTLAAWPSLQEPHAPSLARYAALQSEVLSPSVSDLARGAARQSLVELVQRVQGEARQARLQRAVHSERQLEQVLVEFWFNHFNVFAGKETVRITAGHFESEAIRPHVLGRFRELLGATARHPAMLNYLDNWQSVVAGFRPPPGVQLLPGAQIPRGLNENYARELLELHTLGAQGGYTQSDVTELARIFTGWSFDRRNPGPTDAYRFYSARHDGGPKQFLGQTVPLWGQRQGEWALDVLARHPSTAKHIAGKLARAFVADDPPIRLVERLAQRFIDTDGDLREVMRSLAFSPEFLDPAVRGVKFKTPYHHAVSAVRACGLPLSDARPLAGAIGRMGMPIYLCPTPDGWRDAREAWLNAEALRLRVEFGVGLAETVGRSGPGPTDQRRAAPALQRVAFEDESADARAARLPEPVWSSLGSAARQALQSLTPRDRLGLALASPDFMKR